MSEFTAFIVEVLFRRWITRFIGLNSRCFFLNLIGQKVNKKMLLGNEGDFGDQISQDFYNAVVGMLVLLYLILGAAHVYDWLTG